MFNKLGHAYEMVYKHTNRKDYVVEFLYNMAYFSRQNGERVESTQGQQRSSANDEQNELTIPSGEIQRNCITPEKERERIIRSVPKSEGRSLALARRVL